MAKQTDSGKAFEYSIGKCYYHYLINRGLNTALVNDKNFLIAKGAYDRFSAIEQKRYDIAAKNTIETLIALEPGLVTQQNSNDILKIRLAADAEGIAGDVRDVIFTRDSIKPKWEIGFSAKNNHDAVKHSRLSPKIDFGEKWLGLRCSSDYFKEINFVFDWLATLKKKDAKATWPGLGKEKMSKVYMPLLLAFRRELLSLNLNNPKIVPNALLSYLIGRHPFYKIKKDDKNNLVIVKAFNLGGLLNNTVGKSKPKAVTPKINLASRIIEFDFPENSSDTLMMTLDKGWQISFRIHSASTLLETSLKFDINLIGNPPILFTQHLFAI